MAAPSTARALCAAAARLGVPRRPRSAPATAPRGAAPQPAVGRGTRAVPPPPASPRGAERGPPPAVDFGDTREAFRSKSSAELLRGLVVLGLCAVGPLVEHNREVGGAGGGGRSAVGGGGLPIMGRGVPATGRGAGLGDCPLRGLPVPDLGGGCPVQGGDAGPGPGGWLPGMPVPRRGVVAARCGGCRFRGGGRLLSPRGGVPAPGVASAGPGGGG